MCSDPERENYAQKFLSHDLIIEILSFLPVKSVLRFKCVCNSWCADIQGSYFIEKHRVRAKTYWKYDSKEFQYVTSKYGLVVEKSNLNHKYRIRNPMIRQVLDLPDPIEELCAVRMFYIPTSQNYKLFSLYCKEQGSAGCKVLTVGTDLGWRHLDVPSLSNLRREEKGTNFVTDDMLVLLGYDASEICCIDVGSECMFSVKVPDALISSGWEDDFLPRFWDGKLSLAKVEKKCLHGWVLEDYKTQKWAERKIALDFMNVYPDTTTKYFLSVVYNWVWVLVDENQEHLLSYGLKSRTVCVRPYYTTQVSNSRRITSTLVHIKGMQPEMAPVEGI